MYNQSEFDHTFGFYDICKILNFMVPIPVLESWLIWRPDGGLNFIRLVDAYRI